MNVESLETFDYPERPTTDERQSILRTYACRAAGSVALVGAVLASSLFGNESSADTPDNAYSIVVAGSPGCYGDYCSGKDAELMGCGADATTIASAVIKDENNRITVEPTEGAGVDVPIPAGGAGVLELRYSKECQTTWGRVRTTQGSRAGLINNIDAVGVKQDGGYSQERSIAGLFPGSPPNISRTPMIYGPKRSYMAYVEISGANTLPYQSGTVWTEIGQK